ncbi:MAG TPA: pilus assembly protein PilB [Lentisphaeria bacterium]|nr:MAG: pilus assembly protein PilB [Lentisphaerae bacterium GWF2_38_69]HBM14736.1 pilus assembly protein PilB [Lentisphaeria bacterium]
MDTESIVLKEIMLSESLIDKEQVTEIEEEINRTGKPFADILVAYQFVTKEQLLEIIASYLGTEVLDLNSIEIPKEIVKLLEPAQARMYGALPIGYESDGTLKVTLIAPLNYQVSEDLSFIINKRLKVYVASQNQIFNTIEKYYPTASLSDVLADLEPGVEDVLGNETDENKLSEAANNAPIIKFVDVILYQAVKDQSSDIHFEPFENSFKIRYRVDGVLYEMAPPPKNLATPVISRIKIMSNLNISERRLPQDGRIQVRIAGKVVDLRVSTLPTQFGESVVLRILDKSIVNLDLNSLGIDEIVLEQIRKLIERPNGIFIVTGPTGSGKTTTLYSCLKEINKVTDKILTAEEPVEYDLEGVIQVPINTAINMTFARALRAFLRQDPDIIMLGEIRDLETAQMAVQASLTGHFVFSTLHTKEAADAITRLIDMGVMPYLITSSLVGVIGQRLLRRICKSCKTSYVPKEEELKMLGLTSDDVLDKKFYYGKGCSFCNNTGYKGRKAIVELIRITPEICELINKFSPTITIRRKAIEQGMVTMRNDGIKAVFNGETTMEEVLKYT